MIWDLERNIGYCPISKVTPVVILQSYPTRKLIILNKSGTRAILLEVLLNIVMQLA